MNINTTFWFFFFIIWMMVGLLNYLANPNTWHENNNFEELFYHKRERYLNVSVVMMVVATIGFWATWEVVS